jgi:hypothetical protein
MSETPSKPFFDLTEAYSRDQLVQLYLKKPTSRFAAERFAQTPTRDSVFFYWDQAAKKMVNPFNLQADASTKPGTYSINAELLSFHPSSADSNGIWKDLSNNLQVTFNIQAAEPSGDLVQWLTMAGLQIASDFMSGQDSRLLSLTDNNQMTDFRPAEQVQIVNGQVDMMVSLAGQKKKSFWDDLLQIFKSVTDSPIFGLLPIPKLYSTAVSALNAFFNQVEQQQRLIKVLSGKKLKFRIYDGTSTNPFLLKPGYWVILDAQAAASHMDNMQNLDLVLDVPGQLYEVKDKDNRPVDITYCVAQILLPPVKS